MAQPIWTTSAGLIGSYPSLVSMNFQLVATPVPPAVSVTYTFLSGSIPNGVTLTSTGLLSGIPALVSKNTPYTFTVRAIDNLGNLRDRTFILAISGSAIPQFTTPSGGILSTQDSVWVDLPIGISNPLSSTPYVVRIKEGELPPGLEINELGVIRGYANPPTITTTKDPIVTISNETSSINNLITVNSTVGFTIGRTVIFTGTMFSNIVAGAVYYIKSIPSPTTFTISSTQNGAIFPITSGTGTMLVTLPSVSTGEPTIRTYTFTLEILSPLGNTAQVYSITIINQNLPVSQGGPGNPPNSRLPVILNTRPLTYNISTNDPYYGYYILPPVAPTQYAQIGTFQSGNYFSFKVIGDDFDGNLLKYSFSNLPLGLTGNTNTGWITGTATLTTIGISTFNFSVAAYKADNPAYISTFFNFSFTVENQITSRITWLTDSDLGTINNGTISNFAISASSDVDIVFELVSGSLPPNLTLLPTGDIVGRVADQPTDTYLLGNSTSTFDFTVQAYSQIYPSVLSTKNFTISVFQEFTNPTDTLYIKAAPSIEDRVILKQLLDSTTIFPEEAIYRPDDIYFGKASSVVYEHAYGIYASDIQEYLEAVTRNHYWRFITLGEIKTAVARDSSGEIIYEVVYSQVIDNLVNPNGVSINSPITWPRQIDLHEGPWYTSVTNIFASYADVLDQLYYTSLSPGYARTLYPNSLYNMRQRVGSVLGQEYNSKILPAWMTSQQLNGSTLGFTPAWVICYTKPGYAETIKNNIATQWLDIYGDPYTLNLINFEIDRFSVDKSATYDFLNKVSPPAWTGLPSASPAPEPIDSKDFYVLFPRKTILPK